MFKLRKVFDCQDMPEEIKQNFFERYHRSSNDVFIDFFICDIKENPVMQWLVDNGAEKDEMILIKYWW